MRYKRMKLRKRIGTLFLCLCMILTCIPTSVYAEYTGGSCEHHTEHTAECGYVAASEGSLCMHVHDENCGYREAVAEVLCSCTQTDENGMLIHTEGCGYVAASEGSPCTHTHDASCGYAEATEGSPCTYVCEICSGNNGNNGENSSSGSDGSTQQGGVNQVNENGEPVPYTTMYSIKVADTENGSISVDKTYGNTDKVYWAQENVQVTLTATASQNYKLEKLYVYENLGDVSQITKGNCIAESIETTCMFTMPSSGVYIEATFVPNMPFIQVNLSDNGSVSVNGESNTDNIYYVEKGSTVTLTAIPSEDYKVETVKVEMRTGDISNSESNGYIDDNEITSLGNNQYKFTMSENNFVKVSITFKQIDSPDFVAQVERDKKYKSLQDAIDAVSEIGGDDTSEEGGRILILQDITITEAVEIKKRTIRLELQEHSITSSSSAVFYVSDGSHVSISGTGTVSGTYGVIAEGQDTEVSLTKDSGEGTPTITGTSSAVKLQDGKLQIYAASLKGGYAGVEIYGGNVELWDNPTIQTTSTNAYGKQADFMIIGTAAEINVAGWGYNLLEKQYRIGKYDIAGNPVEGAVAYGTALPSSYGNFTSAEKGYILPYNNDENKLDFKKCTHEGGYTQGLTMGSNKGQKHEIICGLCSETTEEWHVFGENSDTCLYCGAGAVAKHNDKYYGSLYEAAQAARNCKELLDIYLIRSAEIAKGETVVIPEGEGITLVVENPDVQLKNNGTLILGALKQYCVSDKYIQGENGSIRIGTEESSVEGRVYDGELYYYDTSLLTSSLVISDTESRTRIYYQAGENPEENFVLYVKNDDEKQHMLTMHDATISYGVKAENLAYDVEISYYGANEISAFSAESAIDMSFSDDSKGLGITGVGSKNSDNNNCNLMINASGAFYAIKVDGAVHFRGGSTEITGGLIEIVAKTLEIDAGAVITVQMGVNGNSSGSVIGILCETQLTLNGVLRWNGFGVGTVLIENTNSITGSQTFNGIALEVKEGTEEYLFKVYGEVKLDGFDISEYLKNIIDLYAGAGKTPAEIEAMVQMILQTIKISILEGSKVTVSKGSTVDLSKVTEANITKGGEILANTEGYGTIIWPPHTYDENDLCHTYCTVCQKQTDENHLYEKDAFHWNEDYSACTLTLKCLKNNAHTKTVDCTVTPDTRDRFKTIYTASVTVDGNIYTDTKEEEHQIVEVDIAWDQMKFEYQVSDWDTENHVYKSGEWVATGDAGDAGTSGAIGRAVMVTNTGNVDVNAKVSYINAENMNFTGIWTIQDMANQGKPNINADVAENVAIAEIPATKMKRFVLAISGQPSEKMKEKTIGYVNIVITPVEEKEGEAKE